MGGRGEGPVARRWGCQLVVGRPRAPTPVRAGWGWPPLQRDRAQAAARPCSRGGPLTSSWCSGAPVRPSGPVRRDPSACQAQAARLVAAAPRSPPSPAGAVSGALTAKSVPDPGAPGLGLRVSRGDVTQRPLGSLVATRAHWAPPGDVESGWGGAPGQVPPLPEPQLPPCGQRPDVPSRRCPTPAWRSGWRALRGQAATRLFRPRGAPTRSPRLPRIRGQEGDVPGPLVRAEGRVLDGNSRAHAGTLCAQPERTGWDQASLAVGGRPGARWNERPAGAPVAPKLPPKGREGDRARESEGRGAVSALY